jgi:ABC-2 type transport system ATP-binding protein
MCHYIDWNPVPGKRWMVSELAIECRQLIKRYGDLVAVDHLDLEVARGECFGLLGPNGAGKTTTVEILEGLTVPDGGHVFLLGKTWKRRGARKLRARIGVALQETRLPEKLTVLEVVRLFRSFYPQGRSPDEVIDILGLVEKREARVGNLSGGQRQRLALASALVGNPDLLFLDEPTTGLDPQARLRIWEVVETFRKGGGTVLMTTHYMDEAHRLCDRIAIMDRGKGIALDTPDSLIDSLGAEQIIEFPTNGFDPEAMHSLPGVVGVKQRGGSTRLRVQHLGEALPALLNHAAAHGVMLESLTTHRATLEDVYVHLTGRGLRDG